MTQPTQISSFQIQDLWELSASSVPNASTEPSAVARLTPAAPDLPNFTFHEGTKEVFITRAPNHQIIVQRPHNTSTEDIDSSGIKGEPLVRVFALDSDVSDERTFMVEDLSKTGVFHNDRRLTPNQPTLLLHGDEISTKESVSDPFASKPTGRVSYFFHKYEESNFGTETSPLQEKYELLHTLGCGTTSTVKLAIDRNKTLDRYACKIIYRRPAFADCVPRTVRTIRTENEYDSDQIQKESKWESDQEGIHNSQNDDNGKSKAWEGVQREIEILKELSHTNITRFADFYEDAQAIYIIMELIPGGDLLTYISSSSVDVEGLPEFECREFFAQILDAVKYLHEKNIIHRDLKPENILLTANKKTLKITDFGLAIKLDDTRKGAETFCGTPMYAAPEIAQNGLVPGLSVESNEQIEKTPTAKEPSTQNCPRTQLYGPGVDCWACGVTLYMMLTSQSPFESMFMQSMAERSTATYVPHLSPLLPPICTPEVVKLISELLTVDPKRRITAAAARDHSWFRQPRFWGRLTYRDIVDQKNPDGVGDVERKGKVRVELWEKEVTVGRKSGRKIECKLYVDDPRASSRHCVLRSPATSNDDATIVDFSTNGCFVNGEKVKKGVPRSLKDGDELWFVMNPANQRDSVIYTFNVLSMHTLPPESSQEENEAEGEVVNPYGLESPTRLNRKRSIEEIETEGAMSTKKRSKNEQQSSSDSMMAPQVPWGRLVSLVSSRPGVRLAGKKVRCGRLADCVPALRFNDARVSSHHCVFSRTAEGAVTVEDESINGTFVNGARLRKRVPRTLVSGDEIVMFYANQDREFTSEKRGKGTTVGLDSSGKEVLIGYKLEC